MSVWYPTHSSSVWDTQRAGDIFIGKVLFAFRFSQLSIESQKGTFKHRERDSGTAVRVFECSLKGGPATWMFPRPWKFPRFPRPQGRGILETRGPPMKFPPHRVEIVFHRVAPGISILS